MIGQDFTVASDLIEWTRVILQGVRLAELEAPGGGSDEEVSSGYQLQALAGHGVRKAGPISPCLAGVRGAGLRVRWAEPVSTSVVKIFIPL